MLTICSLQCMNIQYSNYLIWRESETGFRKSSTNEFSSCRKIIIKILNYTHSWESMLNYHFKPTTSSSAPADWLSLLDILEMYCGKKSLQIISMFDLKKTEFCTLSKQYQRQNRPRLKVFTNQHHFHKEKLFPYLKKASLPPSANHLLSGVSFIHKSMTSQLSY